MQIILKAVNNFFTLISSASIYLSIYLLLSVKATSSTIFFFWVGGDSTWDWILDSQAIAEHFNHLVNGSVCV